jgi:methanogenic corrinoid protein MtbC1
MTQEKEKENITGKVVEGEKEHSFNVSKEAIAKLAEHGINAIAALEAALKKGVKTVPKED